MFVGEKSDPQRFHGAGINFKAKLIGIEDVAQANGDRMCQEAIHRLKGSVKDSGDHKLRLVINVSMNGMKLSEEKTGVGSAIQAAPSKDVKAKIKGISHNKHLLHNTYSLSNCTISN